MNHLPSLFEVQSAIEIRIYEQTFPSALNSKTTALPLSTLCPLLGEDNSQNKQSYADPCVKSIPCPTDTYRDNSQK